MSDPISPFRRFSSNHLRQHGVLPSNPRPAPQPPKLPPLPMPADDLRASFERRAKLLEEKLTSLPAEARARQSGLTEDLALLKQGAEELARTKNLTLEARERISKAFPNLLPPTDRFEGPRRKPLVNLGTP